MPRENFFFNRIKSVGYALKGALLLIRTEASIQIQLCITIVVTIAGFYFEITTTEWIFQIFAIAMVLGIEGINTAIEKMADYVQPAYDKKIGIIKDISAGAVMLVSIGAAIIGFIIYLPKFF